jgi:translation initiation factor 2B subunit (eIF-2B alpha/beta/delta family)
MIQTLEWTDKGVRFIDQTKLPTEEVYVNCKTHEQVADVIRNMVVRGAPAIGVAAAMGIALGVNNSRAESTGDLKRDFDQICDVIGKTRPTAVNLFWAIRRMQEKFERIRIRRRSAAHARGRHCCQPGNGTAWRHADAKFWRSADALQCRRTGNRGIRDCARSDSRGGRAGEKDPRVCR